MIGISFNGGKESLIILHKFLKIIQSGEALVFRIVDPDEFPEMEEYISFISKKYGFSILGFKDMKSSIPILKEKYLVDVVVLGCRKTDPNCSNLEKAQITDLGWEPILRYFPILDWSYSDVWEYIDRNELPVCELYTRGYTSIGNRSNTFPNYYLFNKDKFLHARELKDEKYEREGRIKKKLPIVFSGKVIRGKGMGKGLGFPTANLDVSLDLEEGVYFGTSSLEEDKEEEEMVMSVGVNPMFQDKTIEVHILKKYEEDFYEKILNVKVTGFIRKMKKFNSLEELIQAIQKDIDYSIHLESKNLISSK